jgi:predicted transcriptional regulator
MAQSPTTSLKLDPEIKERVQRLAETKRRTSHWVMREAIEEYVTREEARERVRQDVLTAWQEYEATGLHITGEEADAWLKQLARGERAKPPKSHR